MRNRRIVTILVSAAVSAAVLPLSVQLAGTLAPRGSQPSFETASVLGPEVPPLSAATDPTEHHLLAQASQQVVAEREAAEAAAAAARQARLERLARQEASRDAAQQRLLQVAAATPAPPPAPAGNDVWARLRQCEAGGNYAANTGNGYYGAYQFSAGTWRSLGYPGLPHQAPPEVQDEAARKLQARSGWGQWPACSRRLGLR